MMWFRWSTVKEADREYLARRERLRSEIEQFRQIGNGEKLDALAQDLCAIRSSRPGPNDLLVLIKVEAELCMLKPASLLYPTSLRLRSRFYRFDSNRRALWEGDLTRLLPDANTIVQEDVLRERLRHLTYELNEEAEAYNRLSEEKTEVVRKLTIAGICIIVVLLITVVILVQQLPTEGPLVFDRLLAAGLLTGALGAITSAAGSIADERARRQLRQEYWPTLLVQLILRTVLGAVYASVILAAVSSQIVPMTPKTDASSLAFIFVLTFAGGFSDRLFGQTISQLIVSSSDSPARDGRRGRGRP